MKKINQIDDKINVEIITKPKRLVSLSKLDDDPSILDEGTETFKLSVLFSFSEYLAVIHICEVFKACLY